MGQTAIISPQIIDSTSIGRDLITAADQAAAQAIIGVSGVDTGEDYTWTGDHTFDGSVTFTDTFDAVDGSFSGNLNSEVGGSYKLYNLGTEGDTDTEYLEMFYDGGRATIASKATVAGAYKDISLEAYGNNRIRLTSSGFTFQVSGSTKLSSTASDLLFYHNRVRPANDNAVNLGTTDKRYASVNSYTGNFAGDVVMAANVDFSNLPTADPLVDGRLWNDGGTMKISAG